MTKYRSILPGPKGQHGGRRPGAGAPKGNMNGLRHGLHSRRFYLAALMVAAVPELRQLFHAVENTGTREERQRYFKTLTLAYEATLMDPELASSIKTLVIKRVRTASTSFRPQTRKTKQQNPIKQSRSKAQLDNRRGG